MDSAAWDARYRDKDFVWSLTPNRFVEERCRELAPGTALDLAAGEGRNAVWLATLGWAVVAVDFSAVALEKAEALAAANGVTVTTVEADLASWAPAASFDLVVLSYLQVAEPVLEVVLPMAVESVGPGGHLLVVAHHPDNLTDGWGGPPSPDVLYPPERVTTELEGWSVLEAARVERPVDTAEASAVALDTVVFARREP